MPLFAAVSCDHLAICRLLLDRGCDKDAMTVLHLAASNGFGEICELLFDRGCDMNARGSAGSRPLVPALFAYGMAWSSPERTGSQTVSKTPEQREQVRAAQVAHPPASTGARSATAPAVRLAVRIGVATGLEGTRGALAAASCARVSITQVATCFRPRDLCGSGEGHVITSTWMCQGRQKHKVTHPPASCGSQRTRGDLHTLVDRGCGKDARTNKNWTPLYIPDLGGHVGFCKGRNHLGRCIALLEFSCGVLQASASSGLSEGGQRPHHLFRAVGLTATTNV